MRPDSRTRTQPVVLALVTDIVCVVVFCTAGRPVTVPKTDRRIAQTRQLFDDDVVAGHRYGAASKRPNFRQHLERRSESGDLREDLLGSADHLSVLDVVSGLVPRADQSPVLDRSARQVCAQMSTPPRDREVFAVDVSNGIRSRTGHRPRGADRKPGILCSALPCQPPVPPTVLNTSLSAYPRPHAVKHPQNAADRNSDDGMISCPRSNCRPMTVVTTSEAQSRLIGG